MRCLLLALAILAAACHPEVTAPREAPPVTPSISDGAHLGNQHFYFLPPMQSMPTYGGTTDPSASPAVSICEWNPVTSRCGDVIAEFARGGTGATQISYDVMGEKYHVNWHTDECISGPCTLDPLKIYRIRVMVGGTELGHADVDVVSSGSQLKNVQTNEYIGLVNGRTLPIKFRIEQGAVSVVAAGGSAPVGAAGGAVTTPDGGVALVFPAGALAGATNISVTEVASPADGTGPWAPVVDLGPDGSTFSQPVTLSIEYKPENLPEGVPSSALMLVTFDGAGWVEVPGSTIDSVDNRVSAPISHFSIYAVRIWPNYVTGGIPNSLRVGDSTSFQGAAYEYRVIPWTYCRWVRTGWFSRRWVCTTIRNTYSVMVPGVAIFWQSSSPAIASVPPSPTYTDQFGLARSPRVTGHYPGNTGLTARAGTVVSPPQTITVLGVLGLLPKTATNTAGWAVGERITSTIPLTADQPVQLTNKNGFLTIGEPGTSNYTYGGQTGTYVLTAGATFKQLVVHGLAGVGTDTLIAAAPGFVPDTAIITLRRGKFLVTGWPASLTVGDSAALQITVADSTGALGSLSQLITVSLTADGPISFSNGSAAVTTVPIQQRTSATFYVKATGAGSGTMTITHPDYGPYSNTVSLTGVPIIVTDPADRLLNTMTVAAGGLGRKSIPVSNGGSLPLTGLSLGPVTTCADGQPAAWLNATLAGATAPTTLNLVVTPSGSTTPGSYELCFQILATAPGTTPKSYGVTVTMQPALVGAQTVCGHTIAGVGYDGTYYYVGEAHDGLLQCISRWTAATGQLSETRQIFHDHRGLHWIPALGKLTSRTWGGPIFTLDFFAGTRTHLASNPTVSRPGDEQSQPAVDPDGVSYWIRNAAVAERRRLSDHGLLASFPVTSTGSINTIAVSNVWVFVLDGAAANAYSKVTGRLAGTQPLPHAHPCNNFGFGVSLSSDRILYLSDCRHVEVVPVTVTFAEPDPSFSLTDLGTLGGGGDSEALTLNDAGRIVGVSNQRAFYMDAGATTPSAVPNPFGDISWAPDVNASGLVGATNPYVGYLYNPATNTITGQVPGPFTQNNRIQVIGLNNTGMVLACADNGSFFQSFVWTIAADTTLIPNAYNSCSGKINDAGLAIANADPGAGGTSRLWNQATQTATVIPSLGGVTVGRDLNASGVAVGNSEIAGLRHAFRYDPATGQTRDLGTLGGNESEAMGINNAGFIVGWGRNASGQKRGFIYDAVLQRMFELAPLPGHTESQANDVNQAGVIVGYSSVGGVKRAVRWIPQ